MCLSVLKNNASYVVEISLSVKSSCVLVSHPDHYNTFLHWHRVLLGKYINLCVLMTTNLDGILSK